MEDITQLLVKNLPVIRASAAVGNDLALALLSNYDLWLKMRNAEDPNVDVYARGVRFAYDKWWEAENDKLK